jgi:hypothetical protein
MVWSGRQNKKYISDSSFAFFFVCHITSLCHIDCSYPMSTCYDFFPDVDQWPLLAQLRATSSDRLVVIAIQ